VSTKRLVVETRDGPMTTLVWHPEGEGPFPVVVCYHHGPGMGEEIYATARRFADEGYYAAVPDLYHRIGEMLHFDVEELMKNPASPEMDRLMGAIAATTPELMLADTQDLVRALRGESAADQGAKGCLGYCHTARAVIRVMADMPDEFVAGSILHPSLTVTQEPDSPHLFVKHIRGQIYAGFGAMAELAPVASQEPLIQELQALGPRAVIEVHADGGHGFMWPGTPAYDPQGAGSAWNNTLEIFGRMLRPHNTKEATA
jgi:carboxymethylenebutenolidase